MSDPLRAPWWLAVAAAIGGGSLLGAAAPGTAWWPGGILGAVLICAALWQQRTWWGVAIGTISGVAYWAPLISWLTLYLGPVPWIGLCVVMVAWWALSGGLIAFSVRQLGRLRTQYAWWLVAGLQSLTFAGIWVAREQVQSNWPYGGFAWGRLAHSIADAPGVGVVSWLGFAGTSGLLAVAAAGLVALGWRAYEEFRRTHRVQRAAVISGSVVTGILASVLVFTPAWDGGTEGELRVAAVQGNSKSAIFDDRESGSVVRDHIEATESLLDTLEAAGDRVDVIVWPENSAEFNIAEQFFTAQRITKLAARAEAPIILGSILENADGGYSNSTLVFTADGVSDLRYDKRRPVPFAEYMPNRDFFRALAPELVDLVQLEYSPGERSAVLPIDTLSGEILAGIAICFDIIFDDQAEAMLYDGAQVIFAQTNNADFGETDQSAQQLQIARLRAVEMGRSLVNISTVGTSAIVAPDGEILESLTPFTADAMVATVQLSSTETPAMRLGAWWSTLWVLVAVGGVGLSVGVRVALRQSQRQVSAEAPSVQQFYPDKDHNQRGAAPL